MGGLLCCHAYQHLYIARKEGLLKYYSGPDLDPELNRLILNITAIITYETPFFGINSQMHRAATSHIQQKIAGYSSSDIVSSLLPKSLNIPIGVLGLNINLGTKTLTDTLGGLMQYMGINRSADCKEANDGVPKLALNTAIDYSTEIADQSPSLGETSVALCSNIFIVPSTKNEDAIFEASDSNAADTTATEPQGSIPLRILEDIAKTETVKSDTESVFAFFKALSTPNWSSSVTQSSYEDVRKHLEFLTPLLLSTTSSQKAQINECRAHECMRAFHNFNLNSKGDRFCKATPADSDVGFESVFTTIDTTFDDPIQAHMNMFNVEGMRESYGMVLEKSVLVLCELWCTDSTP